jgi:outer membrane murein-binding lipoprotein Lpp
VTLALALIVLALIILTGVLLWSYESDVNQLAKRTQQLEAHLRKLSEDTSNLAEYQIGRLWQRAQTEVDRQIAEARQRNQQ